MIPYADLELHPAEPPMTRAEFARFIRDSGLKADAEAVRAEYRRRDRVRRLAVLVIGIGLAILALLLLPAAVNVTASEPSGTTSMPGTDVRWRHDGRPDEARVSVDVRAGAAVLQRDGRGVASDAAAPRVPRSGYPADGGPAALAASPAGAPTLASIRGTATWYCGGGSPCTAGYSPSDLIAAIDPSTGLEQGERITVWHGDRSVTVRIVDVCQCDGARIIDLSRLAFSRLADPSRGIISVVLIPARGQQDAAPQMTLPPTSTEGGTP